MKKKDDVKSFLVSVGIGLVVTALIIVGTQWLDHNTWKIPQAHNMASVAMKVQTEKESFKELEKRVSASIRVDAAKGARHTEVYVGEFSTDAVQEIQRELAFCGYRNELTSFLSGKNDFLKIYW